MSMKIKLPSFVQDGDVLVLTTSKPIETPKGWEKITPTVHKKVYKKKKRTPKATNKK